MSDAQQDGAVHTISVGDDIVLAQALAASLAAEGIETELVLSSDPYVGLNHTSPHRLMIRESDAEAARPIIAAHLGDALIEEPSSTERSSRRSLVGMALLGVFAGGPLIVLVVIVREVLSNM